MPVITTWFNAHKCVRMVRECASLARIKLCEQAQLETRNKRVPFLAQVMQGSIPVQVQWVDHFDKVLYSIRLHIKIELNLVENVKCGGKCYALSHTNKYWSLLRLGLRVGEADLLLLYFQLLLLQINRACVGVLTYISQIRSDIGVYLNCRTLCLLAVSVHLTRVHPSFSLYNSSNAKVTASAVLDIRLWER